MSVLAARASGAGVLDRLQVLRSAPTPLRGAPAATWPPSPRTGVRQLRVAGPGLQPWLQDTTTTRTDPAGSTLATPVLGPRNGVTSGSGGGYPSRPPTPPCVRFRTRRFKCSAADPGVECNVWVCGPIGSRARRCRVTHESRLMATFGRLLPGSLGRLSSHDCASVGIRDHGLGPGSRVRASGRCDDPSCPLLTSARPLDSLSAALARGQHADLPG